MGLIALGLFRRMSKYQEQKRVELPDEIGAGDTPRDVIWEYRFVLCCEIASQGGADPLAESAHFQVISSLCHDGLKTRRLRWREHAYKYYSEGFQFSTHIVAAIALDTALEARSLQGSSAVGRTTVAQCLARRHGLVSIDTNAVSLPHRVNGDCCWVLFWLE